MNVIIGIIIILKGIFWFGYTIVYKMDDVKDDAYLFMRLSFASVGLVLFGIGVAWEVIEDCLNKTIGILFIVEALHWLIVSTKQKPPKDEFKGAFVMYAIFNIVVGISIWTKFINICE